MKEKTIYCALANSSVSIEPNYGRYRPCCDVTSFIEVPTTQDPIELLNSKELIELRSDLINGKWPKSCRKCQFKELYKFESRRLISNNLSIFKDIPISTHVEPNNVRRLEIFLGNKCNSKCLTCNDGCSSAWVKEHQQIWNSSEAHNLINITSVSYFDKLLDAFPNVLEITFTGGEPLYNELHLYYLNKLIHLDRSKEISLLYNSNCTIYKEEIVSIWRLFKQVHISLSIDAIGKENDYIRYPSKWSLISENLYKYFELSKEPFFTIALSSTLNAFNIHSFDKLIKFWMDTNLMHGTVYPMAIHLVDYPGYASLNALPYDYKNQVLDKLKKIYNYHPDYHETIKYVLICIKGSKFSDKNLKELKHFVSQSDKFRNHTIKDYIPDLYHLLFENND